MLFPQIGETFGETAGVTLISKSHLGPLFFLTFFMSLDVFRILVNLGFWETFYQYSTFSASFSWKLSEKSV